MGMKCEVQSCDNEATVHLTEIRDGKKHEMHLCERCAAEKGLPGKSTFSIADLLAGIASQAQTPTQKSRRGGKETACPVCSTTLSQFQSSGRFGCPDCYTTFKDDVQGLVEKIHDSSQHVGKVPRRVSSEISLQKDIRQLQVDLKRAVRREDYEKAAAIRDQIRQMEEKLKSAGGEPPAAAPEQEEPKEPPPKPSTGGHGHGHGPKKKPHSEGGESKK
jgi:protein arginine kinase activator